MLGDDEVHRAKVVIYKAKVISKLLREVNSLKQQEEEFFVLLRDSVLVIKLYKIFEGHLRIQDATILPLFNADIVEDFVVFRNLEQLFLDGKLVPKRLLFQILLHLSLKDHVENTFLDLLFGYLEDVLGLLLELVASAHGINNLKDVRIQRIVEMLNGLNLEQFRRLILTIFYKHCRVLVDKSYDPLQVVYVKYLLFLLRSDDCLLVIEILKIRLVL